MSGSRAAHSTSTHRWQEDPASAADRPVLRAVVFDLDGVLTDTAEYHYQAWQQLADEEGLAFDREINERLRGVSREQSLDIVLAGRALPATTRKAWLERKNAYYVALLGRLTSADLLPGAQALVTACREAGMATAIASASRNTPTVLAGLGIAELFDAVVDGNSVVRSKPEPDVFLAAAERLGVPAGQCVVLEDAEAGVVGALQAGMWVVGLGPAVRVGRAHARFADLSAVDLATLRDAIAAAAWTVRQHDGSADSVRHQETVFTIGNGHFCVRGSFEEGHPGQAPASFMHGVWDAMPVQVTELAALPAWWGIDLWVDGARLQPHVGMLTGLERQLDLRTGLLTRGFEWTSAPGAPRVAVRFERFVSLDDRHTAAVRVGVTLLSGDSATLRVRAGLNAHVENTGLVHWDLLGQHADGGSANLLTRTRTSGIILGSAAVVQADPALRTGSGDADGQPCVELNGLLQPGRTTMVTKFVAIVSGVDHEDPWAHAQALAGQAAGGGWERLQAASSARWAALWRYADVLVDGAPEAQIALRYNVFQLLIAAPRFTEQASLGAKTLSGFGYRHHVFWDTEIFMLPPFVFSEPQVARNMLMYRWHRLPEARAKAAANGYRGAQFPWESADSGAEVTPTWVPHFANPHELVRIWTGDVEIHITADIAFAVLQYWRVSGDDGFLRAHGAELVLDGARFWASAAHLEADGRYHYRDVIGPDEYHERVDDNAYTNYFARWHLQQAAALLDWLAEHAPADAARLRTHLQLDDDETDRWRDVADRVLLPVDPDTDLLEQFEGYLQLTDVDLPTLRSPARTTSMQQRLGIEGCARTQHLKQPDVLMLAYLLPDVLTARQHQVNYDYYDPRTDHEHGSSLGPSISAVLACRAGRPDLGYAHFLRAARADLLDVRHNAGDGIHGASAGGLWQAAVFGFVGLRVRDDGTVTCDPMLPDAWQGVRLRCRVHGRDHLVEVARSSGGVSATVTVE